MVRFAAYNMTWMCLGSFWPPSATDLWGYCIEVGIMHDKVLYHRVW